MGADISEEMIKKARTDFPVNTYELIKNGITGFLNEQFNCAMANWVLLSMDSKELMLSALKEIYRIVKPEGLFVALVNNKEDSVGIRTPAWKNGDSNINYKSGNKVVVSLYNDTDDKVVYLDDYYWLKEDYHSVLAQAGFKDINIYVPEYDSIKVKAEIKYLTDIGFLKDNIDYTELTKSKPTWIIVAKKMI